MWVRRANGRRCTERTFLEFHHKRAYAQGGRATVDNISLRCRRHNQYVSGLLRQAGARTRGHDSSPRTDRMIAG